MTKDEFRDWFRYHCARFTGIRSWLAKVTTGVDAPSEAEILRGWYGVLRNVELVAAKNASDLMLGGEVEEPRGFDRHPAAIRRAAGLSQAGSGGSRNRTRYDSDGNQTYSCLVCFDSGHVICWHPTSMKAAKGGSLGNRFTLYSIAVVCSCSAGQEKNHRSGFPVFNSQFWLPLVRAEDGKVVVCDMSNESEQARLSEWMANYEPAKPENYEAEFAEFV